METKEKYYPKNPRIEIDWDLVKKLAAIHCTQEEIASVVGCSVDTLTRRPEFAEVFKKGREEGKASLRRKQYEIAMNGNVSMLIWLGKQILGQSEKTEVFMRDIPKIEFIPFKPATKDNKE